MSETGFDRVVVSQPMQKAMKKLCAMLRTSNIEYYVDHPYSGDQILIPNGEKEISIICHYGSYGNQRGLLEAWDSGKADPEGWLTAGEAFEYIWDRMENNDEEDD